MDVEYVYSSPIILTDELFSAYGGHTDNTSDGQRKAAYWIAERTLSEDLETYLLPTIVTGTYLYNPLDKFLVLDHTRVTRVIKTSFIDTEEAVYWSQLGTDNVYLSLRDGERGLVDIHWVLGNCNCSSHSRFPYKIQEVYEAGFSSGTSYRADILLALTTYADIILNEIIGYGNESPGDIGVQNFSNQQYTEERVKLTKTAFGSSARAQFIKTQIEKHRRKRHVGL
jgi:hypothetical protein